LACNDGGIGVDAIGWRLARRPATDREEAVGLRIEVAGGRTTVGSDGAGDSGIVTDNENDSMSWDGERRDGIGGSMRRKEILIQRDD
jgi:hypothetical protein